MTSTPHHWRGRSAGKVPFGLKEGQLCFVSDVPTGLACGCRCPDPGGRKGGANVFARGSEPRQAVDYNKII